MSHRVGLLVGRERTFPDALIAEINARDEGVVAEYAKVEATRADKPPPYDVLLDRISNAVTCYRPVLKLARLAGTRVVDNPFWQLADDKFCHVALARQLGFAVPKTAVLPSRSYPGDIQTEALERNLKIVDWEALEEELGFPMYVKPYWSGGWRELARVRNHAELMALYNRSGMDTLMVQEEIRWKQYIRCIVIGDAVQVALWDPREYHHVRYQAGAQRMPPLDDALKARAEEIARTMSRTVGYRLNSVELAVRDGEPYIIDSMGSVLDLELQSLGEEQFAWVIDRTADLLIDLAKHPETEPPMRWDDRLSLPRK